jgi:3-ketosteroid 9alpha-monooxygenase subunit B
MDTVERALLRSRIDTARLHLERFVSPPDPVEHLALETVHDIVPDPSSPSAGNEAPDAISVYLDGRTRRIPYEAGRTVLATVQAAGMEPPFSCTEGFCGCCMAKLRTGRVRMIKNDFLSERELRDGWVLTCQSIPLTPDCSFEYPD